MVFEPVYSRSLGTTLVHLETHFSKHHAGQLRVAVGDSAEHETVVFLVLMMTAIAGCPFLTIDP